MSTPADELRAAAAQADRDAAAALDASLDLSRHETLLENRLRPVLDRHTDEVWMSRAAEASRTRVRQDGGTLLRDAQAALTEIVGQLRRRADMLEMTAVDYRRAANQIDAHAAAAEAAALQGIAPLAAEIPAQPIVPDRFGVR
ncbi:MAG: hypothetical protein AAGC53_12580 [Actinomycetota bacterium]